MTLHLDLGKQSAQYQLHPVVVFSILDHYKRRADGQQRVVGTLLGEKRGNQIFIKNSFPVPHQEDEDQVAVDMEYHSTMLQLHQKVYPRESVVGWYTTGDQISYVSSLIHDVYRTHNGVVDQNPVHVTVDVTLQNPKMGVKAYTGHTVRVGDRSVLARFEQASLSLHAHESERIGVDALINGQPDDKQLDAPATILSEFDNLEHSMIKLLESLEIISNYVDKVESKQVPGDLEIGRQIATAIAAIPHLDKDSFETLFNSNLQDLLMIVYLANLTRAQLTLADRITGMMS